MFRLEFDDDNSLAEGNREAKVHEEGEEERLVEGRVCRLSSYLKHSPPYL